jgi:hypothetical protein
MRIGLIASILVHIIIVAWVLLGLTFATQPDPSEAIPVDLVQVENTEKPKAPSPPTSAGRDATPSVEPKSDPKADAKTEPKTDAQTEPKTGPKADAKTDPKTAPNGDPKTDPKTRPAEAADKQGGDGSPPPPNQLEAAPALGAVPELSVNDIAALIGASGSADSGGVVASNPAAGLPQDQVEAVRAQVQRCWEIPNGWSNPRQVSVAVRFRLKKDGTVDGKPVITEFHPSPIGKAAADKAVLAIERCGPYQLPADSYDKWRLMELHLAPS